VQESLLVRHVTLDDAVIQAAASADPVGFVAGLPHGTVIDEVQRSPELSLAIKARIDRDRRPGAFLLTSSADVLVLPALADALVGRAEILTLLPLSAGELSGAAEDFLAWAFGPEAPSDIVGEAKGDVIDRLLQGGFPEPALGSRRFRERWFGAYVTTIVQRAVRELDGIAGLTELPRLLAMLAARSASLLKRASQVAGWRVRRRCA
jgi:hypothetical protein